MRLLVRACQYAKQTSRRCVRFNVKPVSQFNFEAWCDSSFGSHTHEAQTGFIVSLNGSPVCWRSTVQKRTSHSTVKAEAEAMHDCIDRMIVLMYFLSELKVTMKCTLFTDALDLIKLLKSDHPKPTARHMLMEIRQMQDKLTISEKEIKKLVVPLRSLHDMLRFIPSCSIKLEHISGTINPADPLSKPVDSNVLVSKFMSNLSS